MRSIVVFLAAALLTSVTNSGAADTNDPVIVGPMPEWVESIPLPPDDEGDPTQLKGGVRYLLVDYQVHRTAGRVESYGHIASKIVSQEGVQQEAQLSFQVDPSYQELVLHMIQIRRGTNVLSRLDRSAIKVVQRERDLDRRIYDGTLTALVFMEDVRVGDVIEYAYTVRGVNPVFGDRYVDSFVTRYAVPVGQIRVRLLWPSDRMIRFKHHQSDVIPTMRKLGDQTEYVWEQSHVPAMLSDGQLPVWYQPYSWLQFSEFADWKDVARWAAPLYEKQAMLSPVLLQKVDEWRQRFPGKEQQLLAALQFVQDEVRYLGIELGASSHAPAEPNIVAERRFGDCKDKTRLLCSLLNALGIEAHPALVSTWLRRTVGDSLPSPLCFNHTIAYVLLNGKSYWLDSTRPLQRGRLSTLYVPEFGLALVVGEATEGLTSVRADQSSAPLVRVYERYDAQSFTNPATLHIETVRSGLSAEELRSYLAQTTQEQLDKDFSNSHARQFPTLRLMGHVRVKDDTAQNVLTITQDYAIPGFWELSDDRRQWSRDLSPSTLRDYVERPRTIQRTMPLGIEFPVHLMHTIEVLLPKEWNVLSTNVVVMNKAMEFKYNRTYTNKLLRMTYEYETSSDEVAPDELTDYLKAMDSMDHWINLSVFTSVKEAAAVPLEGINWQMVVMALLFGIIMVGAATWLYRFSPSQPPQLPEAIDSGLRGISGWLLLPSIGIAVNPFIVAFRLVSMKSLFLLRYWRVLTTPGGAAYHPLYASLLIGEMFSTIFFMVFSFLVAILFFQKRRTFVVFMISFMILNLLEMMVDHTLAQQIPAVAKRDTGKALFEIMRVGMVAVIWIPYFLKSRRVRATFVN